MERVASARLSRMSIFVYMYMHIYTYIYMYVHIYQYIYTHTYFTTDDPTNGAGSKWSPVKNFPFVGENPAAGGIKFNGKYKCVCAQAVPTGNECVFRQSHIRNVVEDPY